jgi:hypothetical protein
MNEVLRPYLRRFVLVFFDNILVYSSSWSKHLQHVRLILTALKEHQLFMKCAKCAFGRTNVSYLNHVISAVGVTMDQLKVQAMLDLPVPNMVRVVCAFLVLAGYYRRFIHDYSVITTPLTKLLRKGGFVWGPEAEDVLRMLQRALTTASVLQLPDFNKPFTVECDALGTDFDVVLHQGTGLVAYFNRSITTHHAKLVAYERELIGLVNVVRH